jgi:hypothetical protein
MLDRRFILQNLDDIRQNTANRNVVVDLDEFAGVTVVSGAAA